MMPYVTGETMSRVIIIRLLLLLWSPSSIVSSSPRLDCNLASSWQELRVRVHGTNSQQFQIKTFKAHLSTAAYPGARC